MMSNHLEWTFTLDQQYECLAEQLTREKYVQCTNYGHSIGGQQLIRRHGGEVGDIGERVYKGHQRNGDVNCTWKVPNKTAA